MIIDALILSFIVRMQFLYMLGELLEKLHGSKKLCLGLIAKNYDLLTIVPLNLEEIIEENDVITTI